MASLNEVNLIGHLGNDPEVRYLPAGGAVTNISLATSEQWTDKQSGEKKEKTEWHRVVFFGKLAEIAGEYLKKGSQVFIKGKLQTRKWQDQSGADKYTTEIVVDMQGTMKMLGGKPQNDNQGQGQQGAQRTQQQNQRPAGQPQGQRTAQQSAPPAYNEPPSDFDDDIPF